MDRVPVDFPKEPVNVLDHGIVSLVEVSPSMVPPGRTIEYVIVRSARISYGQDLSDDPEKDKGLIRYLYRNMHTSVFEGISFTFFMRIPNHIATHFIRHRTAKLNVLSQRYTNMSDRTYYNPCNYKDGMRSQPPAGCSKQGSSLVMSDTKREVVSKLFERSTEVMDQVYSLYSDMIKEGVAKECARAVLPQGVYVDMYYTMDLNNFLKMCALRMDENAQFETRIYAKAMFNLVKPLIPTVSEVFEDHVLNGINVPRSLSSAIDCLDNVNYNEFKRRSASNDASASEFRELKAKLKRVRNA